MVDNSIIWIQAHPIWFVTGMCVIAALVAAVSLPRLHDAFHRVHPRM